MPLVTLAGGLWCNLSHSGTFPFSATTNNNSGGSFGICRYPASFEAALDDAHLVEISSLDRVPVDEHPHLLTGVGGVVPGGVVGRKRLWSSAGAIRGSSQRTTGPGELGTATRSAKSRTFG